jgi:SAM-dependent methyltransferase
MTMAVQSSSTYHASDGAAYDLWLGRWTRKLAEPFLDFAQFPDDGDLLDVGCGTGVLTFAMAERWPGRRITGVDLAAPFIAYARSSRRGEQPEFEVGDACALPYGEGQFAGAAAQFVLMFIPRPELAMQEMRRVTRRGGRIGTALWDLRGGLVFERILWDTAASIDPGARAVRDWRFNAPPVLPDGMPRLFREAGLQDIERESLTVRTVFSSFEDYWQPLLGGQGPVGQYFRKAAPDMKARIRDAVYDAYCSGAADGERSFTATAWAVRGRVP